VFKKYREQKNWEQKKIALAQAKKIKSKKFESKKNATHVAKKNLQLTLHWQYAGCVAGLLYCGGATCLANGPDTNAFSHNPPLFTTTFPSRTIITIDYL